MPPRRPLDHSTRLQPTRPLARLRKTSAPQTFVTGKAAYLAGKELRDLIFRLASADAGAAIQFGDGHLIIMEYRFQRIFSLQDLPPIPTATS